MTEMELWENKEKLLKGMQEAFPDESQEDQERAANHIQKGEQSKARLQIDLDQMTLRLESKEDFKLKHPHERLDYINFEVTVANLKSIEFQGREFEAINRALNFFKGKKSLYAVRWQHILKYGGWEDIKAILLDKSEYGVEMRQSMPICGYLKQEEIAKIYAKYHPENPNYFNDVMERRPFYEI